MNVALLCEQDTPGGTERLVLQIAQDLRRRGHGAIVVGPRDGAGKGWLGDEARALGFEYLTIAKRNMLDPRTVLDLVRIIRSRRIDAVHSHEFAPSIFGAMASWLMRRPHVITMHSNLYFAGAWRRRAAFRWAARHSEAVVAVAADTRDDAERLLRLDKDAIRVIPNGVHFSQGKPGRIRAELALRPGEQLVVALGNVSARKAHIILLRALLSLRDRRPDVAWRLAIAGTDQGAAAELRQLAEERGVTDRVHLLGHRSDTEDVLAAADVFAMSSLHEGMPLAIMEAMFASKPVISSRAGGIGEMITDGVEGILTPVGDADVMSAGLERLLTDHALAARLGAAAKLRAERQFGIKAMMDAYFALYTGAARAKR